MFARTILTSTLAGLCVIGGGMAINGALPKLLALLRMRAMLLRGWCTGDVLHEAIIDLTLS